MNSCTFAGRLVADAEMKTTGSGTTLCSFRVASDCGWGDNKKTHWLSCAIFGDRGSKLAPYLRKGDPVTVVGELSPPRTYEAQGETRVAQDMVVREIALQGSQGSRGDAGGSGASGSAAQRSAAPQGRSQSPSQGRTVPPEDFDDDIPF